MSSNVHSLELGRASMRADVGQPHRAEVETAFRTIILGRSSRFLPGCNYF